MEDGKMGEIAFAALFSELEAIIKIRNQNQKHVYCPVGLRGICCGVVGCFRRQQNKKRAATILKIYRSVLLVCKCNYVLGTVKEILLHFLKHCLVLSANKKKRTCSTYLNMPFKKVATFKD